MERKTDTSRGSLTAFERCVFNFGRAAILKFIYLKKEGGCQGLGEDGSGN